MHTFLRAVSLAALLALPATSFAQIRVLMSGGFAAPFEELLPEFQKATGITVTATRGQSQGTGPTTIGAQLKRGVPADMVIMAREGLDELIADGKIVAKSDIDLAKTPLGLSVRAGAPKPDISSVEAFKKTVLNAKGVTYPGSTTGIYLTTKLWQQLGIANEVTPKITNTGVAAVAKGDAEIAIQPVSEIIHAAGADFVGAIPKEIQYVSVFSAALVQGSQEQDAARKLIAFLSGPGAANALKKSGMEPAADR